LKFDEVAAMSKWSDCFCTRCWRRRLLGKLWIDKIERLKLL